MEIGSLSTQLLFELHFTPFLSLSGTDKVFSTVRIRRGGVKVGHLCPPSPLSEVWVVGPSRLVVSGFSVV